MPTSIAITCPCCTQSASSPYYRKNAKGRVTEGCIDACHKDALIGNEEYARWWRRTAAKALRRNIEQGRNGKGY